MDSDETNGTVGSPDQTSSNVSDSKSSFDAGKLQSTLEALAKKLDEVDKRSAALQGDKDRAVTRTAKEVDELKRKFAEVEKLKRTGLDDDSAIEEVSFRDDVRALREQLSQLNPDSQKPAGNRLTVTEEQAEIIRKAGVSANDPAVAKLIAENDDPLELAMKVGEHKAKLAIAPSAADASTMQAVVTGAPDVKALTDKYIKDTLAARGNRELAKAIKAKARKDGVPVDSVNFSV